MPKFYSAYALVFMETSLRVAQSAGETLVVALLWGRILGLCVFASEVTVLMKKGP